MGNERPHFQKSTGLKKFSGAGKVRRDGSRVRKYPDARIIGRTGEQQPWRQTDRQTDNDADRNL